jgi:hypothetical protein
METPKITGLGTPNCPHQVDGGPGLATILAATNPRRKLFSLWIPSKAAPAGIAGRARQPDAYENRWRDRDLSIMYVYLLLPACVTAILMWVLRFGANSVRYEL